MIVTFINKDGEEDRYYINSALASNLDNVKKLIHKDDRDFVLTIDGPEGFGKSSLACQCAKYVDPTFTQDRMCLTPSEFAAAINNGKKGQAVVYDEAYGGLGSSSVLSPINKMLTALMMEMRKKNLFVILVLPSFFYLSKYAALHRTQALLHVYRRGGFISYPPEKKNLLYQFGKRKMSYSYPKVYFYQDFVKKVPIDWEAYENRKIESLKKFDEGKTPREITQRTKDLLERQARSRGKLVAFLKNYSNIDLADIAKLTDDEVPVDLGSDDLKKWDEEIKNHPHIKKVLEKMARRAEKSKK